MFMGDAAHTGSSPSGPNVPLRLAWCVETGNETDFASPILAQGRLYVALAKRGSAGSNGVMALDPADGRELWKRETPAPISHSPAFQDGVVCVVEVGGHVLGFDAATGAPRWEAALEEEEGRYSHAAPTAHKGKFYVRTQKRLARIDARTGAVERSMAIGGAKNDWISAFTSPTIRGPRLALSGMNRNGENLVVMRENDWSRLWGFRADMGLTGGLAMTENRVVFSDFDSTLHCNNLANGATVWELGTSVGSGSGWSATTPATQDGVVVARAGIRTMKALDLADRRERWSFKAKASPLQLFPYRRDRWAIFSSPTIAPGKVFFGSSDGSLYCLDLRTRELLWSRDFGVPVLSTPLVTGNALFVAAYDGRVYAFTGAR
jgi:outer membrane protein assembly factor BamB